MSGPRSRQVVTIDGRRIELSNRGKVLFPESGITKGELVDYYRRVARVALPHFHDRPLTMHRFPDGIEKEGFFQKDLPDYFPDWIERVELKKEGGTVTHVIANETATLVYLANQGCITPHLALARQDRPNHPDRLIFDLDPSDDDFRKVQAAAKRLKRLLDRLGLTPFVQLTGSRGLHIVVPLDRSADFDAARRFARDVAGLLAGRWPEMLTVEQRKVQRGDRVFIDTLRNGYAQTAVASYAVRALEGAPVATPLDWSEVGARDLHPRRYTIKSIFRRLGQRGDPWRDLGRDGHALDPARRRLSELAG